MLELILFKIKDQLHTKNYITKIKVKYYKMVKYNKKIQYMLKIIVKYFKIKMIIKY